MVDETLQMAVMLREETEEGSEAMDRFKLTLLIEITRGIGLEKIVRRELIIRVNKKLKLIYQIMEQKEQVKLEQKGQKKNVVIWK